MTQSSKFEFATLNRKYVANPSQPANKPVFRSLFSSLKEDLLQSQELLKAREDAAASARELQVRKELEAEFQLHRKAGFEEGYAKGFEAKQSEQDQLQQHISSTVYAIKAELERSIKQRQQQLASHISETVSLAQTIAKKVIGNASDDALLANIESSIHEHIPQLMESERVKITVSDKLVPLIKERIDAMLTGTDFSGKLVITANPQMQAGDCLLEWDDGAIKKNTQSLQKMIDTICEQAKHSVS